MGVGLIAMVLFPLSLPILLLTVVATIPLVLPLVVVAIALLAVWGLVRLGARLARTAGPRSRPATSRGSYGYPHRQTPGSRMGTGAAG